jgi:serine protease DegQ
MSALICNTSEETRMSKSSLRRPALFALSLSALVLAALAGGYFAQRPAPDQRPSSGDMFDAMLPKAHAALPIQVDGQQLPSLAPMLEKVTPAVVSIQSKTVVRVRSPLAEDPFFRHFFGMPNMPQERIQQSLGSGVIIDAAKGHILTNNHVIDEADEIQVTLADGRTLEGEILGTDEDTDVALVRVPAENLTAIPMSDSASLRVGDFVVAVGNPFGLGQSVTDGLVSGLGRSGLPGLGFQNFIQTSASINPGNSGGALVNLRGELVGINTAIFNPRGSAAGNIGIGFAIPIDLARDVVRQLLNFGEVRRGTLGVETQEITAEIAQALGLKSRRGAVVTRVQSGTPAAAAGLRPGDVITALDGKAITSPQEFHNAEGLLPVGRAVSLTLLRDGAPLEVSAAVKPRPKDLNGADLDARLAGATLSELPERFRQQGIEGVLVSEVAPNSRAALTGLRSGDLITAINRRDVADLSALQSRLAQPPEAILLTLVRGRNAYFLALD